MSRACALVPWSNGRSYFADTLSTATVGQAPTYTIWGKVVSGLDILQKVATAGVSDGSTDGEPVQPLVITKATTAHQAAG